MLLATIIILLAVIIVIVLSVTITTTFHTTFFTTPPPPQAAPRLVALAAILFMLAHHHHKSSVVPLPHTIHLMSPIAMAARRFSQRVGAVVVELRYTRHRSRNRTGGPNSSNRTMRRHRKRAQCMIVCSIVR
uniref:Putative secreted protein n=1 Tax=Anopheles darlingi TaxID=43151 RepID=A0A2M4D6N8_ANODA